MPQNDVIINIDADGNGRSDRIDEKLVGEPRIVAGRAEWPPRSGERVELAVRRKKIVVSGAMPGDRVTVAYATA